MLVVDVVLLVPCYIVIPYIKSKVVAVIECGFTFPAKPRDLDIISLKKLLPLGESHLVYVRAFMISKLMEDVA